MKFKLEEFLLPWERDDEGKKLEEPVEIDQEKLRKWVYGLMEDKEKAQERAKDLETEVATAKDDLTKLQQEHESDDQRRQREQAEREKDNEKLRKEATSSKRLEIALDVPGITAARAKVLARRLVGENDGEWQASAKEIVEDGFRLSEKKEGVVEETNEDDLTSTPRPSVRRSDGTVVTPPSNKKKSVAEELDAAGITGSNDW